MLADMDDDPRFNNDGVHEIHRQIRTVFNDYPRAVAIGEVWVYDNEQFARYIRADELHLGFNFRLLRAKFDAADIRGAVENSLAAAAMEDATPTWTLANHDVDRESPATAAARSACSRMGDGVCDAGASRRGVHLQR